MRKVFLLALLVTGLLVLASSGVVLAGWGEKTGWSSHGEETGTGIVSEEMRSMEGEPGSKMGPAVGSFEYQEALETGSLPLEGGLESTTPEPSVISNEPQVFEFSGSIFRLGVDTQ
ncbi:MAG: hypothetical protein HZA60_04675 [Deltaproteobacteria bacterium]|nr:hypothetical protein [Deltaproteobacteria bacterium]